jgi:hypothetical protein
VVRSGGVKMIEYERQYICRKCKSMYVIQASRFHSIYNLLSAKDYSSLLVC